jgi:hypothetical protein
MAVPAGRDLVSGTTHDCSTAPALVFVDRGLPELKGLTGPRPICAPATG